VAGEDLHGRGDEGHVLFRHRVAKFLFGLSPPAFYLAYAMGLSPNNDDGVLSQHPSWEALAARCDLCALSGGARESLNA
jgi:hypothetical protein